MIEINKYVPFYNVIPISVVALHSFPTKLRNAKNISTSHKNKKNTEF